MLAACLLGNKVHTGLHQPSQTSGILMKTFAKLAMCSTILAACVQPVPPTDENVYNNMHAIQLLQSCVNQGKIRYLPETMSYLNGYRSNLAGASAEQLKVAQQKVSQQAYGNVPDQYCREIEGWAVEEAAQVAKNRQRRAEASARFDATMSRSWPAAPTYSSPVVCDHYAWGDVTFCR